MVTGYVEAANSREAGGKTYFSMLVDGTWYGTGTVNPKVSKGDKVRFEASQNGKYWNADMKTFESKEGEAPKTSQGKSASSYGGGNKGGNGAGSENWEARQKYWDNKELLDIERQQIISLQAATNTSIEIINSAIGHGIVTIPGSKKADKFDGYVELVKGTAMDLFGMYLSAPDMADGAKAGNAEVVGSIDMPMDSGDDSVPDSVPQEAPAEDGDDW